MTPINPDSLTAPLLELWLDKRRITMSLSVGRVQTTCDHRDAPALAQCLTEPRQRKPVLLPRSTLGSQSFDRFFFATKYFVLSSRIMSKCGMCVGRKHHRNYVKTLTIRQAICLTNL